MKDTLAAPNPMPPLPLEIENQLRASIQDYGVLSPILISAGPAMEGQLVDGFHRRKIARQLGKDCPEIRIPFQSDAEFRIAQIVANTHRRQLSDFERGELGKQIWPFVKELKRAAQGRYGEDKVSGLGLLSKITNMPISMDGKNPEQRRTREIVGAIVGTSGKQVERVMTILESGDDRLIEKCRAKEYSIPKALQALRAPREISINDVIRHKNDQELRLADIPHGHFNAIVIVPPWGSYRSETPRTWIAQRVQALPINDVATANAAVYLWAPKEHLLDAITATLDWRLTLQTILVWERPGDVPTAAGFEDRALFCVVGTTGRVDFNALNYSNIIQGSPRDGSTLPETFYGAVNHCINGPKIVFFDDAHHRDWHKV